MIPNFSLLHLLHISQVYSSIRKRLDHLSIMPVSFCNKRTVNFEVYTYIYQQLGVEKPVILFWEVNVRTHLSIWCYNLHVYPPPHASNDSSSPVSLLVIFRNGRTYSLK